MARVARTKGPEKLSFVRNPAPSSILAALAGGQAVAEFDFTNDSPEVAAFELAVDGLSPDWLRGVGASSGAMAGADGGSGSLRLALTPPLAARVGEYDFSVRILLGGDAYAPPIALVLRVEPADESAIPVEVPPVTSPPPQVPVSALVVASPPEVSQAPAPEKPPPAVKPTPRRRPAAVETTPPVAETSVTLVETPAPLVETLPAIRPIPNPVLAERAAAPPKTPDPEPEPVFSAPPRMSVPQPMPTQPRPNSPEPTITPVQPAPRPRPAPPPMPEPEAVLVEYEAPSSGSPTVEEEGPDPEEEPAVVDLPDGSAFALRPGETKLLRFSFTNETSRETTYVLDEDQSLPGEWITLVQDQVNLTRGGKGDASLRLSPPMNAEPGDYPFTVTLGPQGGSLTPRSLTLTVQATPAVKLSTKETTLKIGPMSSFADFHLNVESAGNADTAFRIAVLPPQTADEQARGIKPVYGTPQGQWQFLFDKELETLRAPASRQKPRPVPIRLRLQRKGPWWFGFRETQQAHVAAVPVTDPTNGGKPINTVEVTAIRQRFWPMPYLTLVPLLLLLLTLFSSGASNLEVTNAQHFGDVYYVLQPEGVGNTLPAKLSWEAPFYALLTLNATSNTNTDPLGIVHGHFTDSYTVPEYGQERTYTVRPLLLGPETSVSAWFVPAATKNMLTLSQGVGSERPRPVPITPQSGSESSAQVVVARHKTLRLTLANMTPAAKGLRINVWFAQRPTDFTVQSATTINSNSINPGESITAQITANPSATPGGDAELTLVTTDAGHQVLHIHLRVQ